MNLLRKLAILPLVVGALAVASCGKNREETQVQTQDQKPAVQTPRRGGEATVLLGSDFLGTWPAGLDPATNFTGGANVSLMSAIYGGLLQLTAEADGSNTRVVGWLAEGYEVKDEGRTIVLHLREGLVFSDGTPFDAEAVRFNIERSLANPCCSPISWPWVKEAPVAAPDPRTVVLRFSRPFGPVINSFSSTNLNWIASPTALKKLGADQFKLTPVGAGPFTVVSNQLSSRLVLTRNSRYFEKDRPYLDGLTFQSTGGDQTALQALLAGDARAYEGMSTTLLIEQAEASPGITVTRQPATSPLVLQLNTRVAPFNKQRAREALYYATNVEAIRKGLFKGLYPASQSFTAPGGLFHSATVPEYRTYDLQKARDAVKEIGGLKVTLGTLRSPVAESVITALQTQWKEAGIEVTLAPADLGTLISIFQGGKWEAMLQTAGAYDPDAGAGLTFRFGSGSPFSGVQDPALDKLIAAATETVDGHERHARYDAVARYLSDKAYAPFIVATSSAQLARGMHGPGLTTPIPALLISPAVHWQDVWVAED